VQFEDHILRVVFLVDTYISAVANYSTVILCPASYMKAM